MRRVRWVMNILGIETSCDETAAAVVEDGRKVLSNIVASQIEVHAAYGGVVPEVASRQHMLAIVPVIKHALIEANMRLVDLHGVAVTYGPGLAGSLLIGVNEAKGLAMAASLPFMGINHLEAHIYAAWLEDRDPEIDPGFPLMCLITSGGHTDLVLMHRHRQFTLVGRTRDDAAGEAFDKAARILGLGFPGGPAIQKSSAVSIGDEEPFTRPQIKGSLDFSFSGLKTALLHRAQQKGWYPVQSGVTPNPVQVSKVARAFQEAVIGSIVEKTVRAAELHKVKGIIVGGGVSANAMLRRDLASESPVPVIIPRPVLCTDNGAMIAATAWRYLRDGPRHDWDLDIMPGLKLG